MTSVSLNLPVPPSVNRTRRLDKRGLGLIERWRQAAHRMVLAQGKYPRLKGPFTLHIVLNEQIVHLDPDNLLKCLLDYLWTIELIVDDSPRYMRRMVVEWGEAPDGCRVTVADYDVKGDS